MSSDAPRVLSLLSAATEIVHRLGCGHLLVGRSHGCDDPPLALTKPVATAPKVDPNASSLELDRAVRAQAAEGGPVYHIYSAEVAKLKPTVIITQEQCRICAVTKDDVVQACNGFIGETVMVTIMPTVLEDVLGDVLSIARALKVEERGQRLVALMRQRLAAIRPAAGLPLPSDAGKLPTVVHLEWLAPLMGTGYWIRECAEFAGATMCDEHGSKGGHSEVIPSPSKLSYADVILLAPCGFSIERTHAELQSLSLLESDGWKALPAVQRGAVAVADGNLYFNRSSCGVVESAEIFAECIHPERACGLFGHHGKRWVWLSELAAFCSREGAPSPNKPVAVAPKRQRANGDANGSSKKGKTKDAMGTPACKHVAAQIQTIYHGDFVKAFGMNSAVNRDRFGNASKFESILRGSESFQALLEHEDWTVASLEGDDAGTKASVRVSDGGLMRFIFDLSRDGERGAWLTDGVRVEC